ncbi:hypothetical protein TL18_04290 [Methanobrevibacter sp. YE315]|uniref:hypothetical protein n=1 Tax=Methanobrevibacter sp. YE315 TaxID=1609968 RepID=UPI000764DB3F|nr:hypothetical protein [Methanobrevibacter sp. YE315]AMD17309.1 hypothetical protein TL18_04290 [Methanobrevibacter sp. YE315]
MSDWISILMKTHKDYVLSCRGNEIGDPMMNSSLNSLMSEWEKYFPKYEIGDELPWDCIDLGYRKSFIRREHKKLFKNELTPWC